MNCTQTAEQRTGCHQCQEGQNFPVAFTMAFQPVVDLKTHSVYAYEALVRGVNGEGAPAILAKVTDENRYVFDQACRVRAIELAAQLKMDCNLSINFLPNAVYEPLACLRRTLETADRCHFPLTRIHFEVTENERIVDVDHLRRIFQVYRQHGFKTSLDDFGAGYAGLVRLAEFQPDTLKIDRMMLTRIDTDPVRQQIVRAVLDLCHRMKLDVIAEGVETAEEMRYLAQAGIHRMQGFLFARPEVEALPGVNWSVLESPENAH